MYRKNEGLLVPLAFVIVAFKILSISIYNRLLLQQISAYTDLLLSKYSNAQHIVIVANGRDVACRVSTGARCPVLRIKTDAVSGQTPPPCRVLPFG